MTDGFYRFDGAVLGYAKNYVKSPDYQLLREKRLDYQFPVDGWRWFDSEADARSFFGLPAKEDDENQS